MKLMWEELIKMISAQQHGGASLLFLVVTCTPTSCIAIWWFPLAIYRLSRVGKTCVQKKLKTKVQLQYMMYPDLISRYDNLPTIQSLSIQKL